MRLTGEVLSRRTCANVALGIGPYRVTTDAGVMDVAKLLGADSTRRMSDLPVSLAPGLQVVVPMMTKGNMIHDGVPSAGFMERAVWTVDLAHGKPWGGQSHRSRRAPVGMVRRSRRLVIRSASIGRPRTWARGRMPA